MPTKPILRDLPESLSTERLLIRCPRPGDGRMINEAIQESLAELSPWLPFARNTPSVDDTEEYVRGAYARFVSRELFPMILLHRATGAFVGSSGLHDIDWDVPAFEIGYWIRTGRAGQGFMTEAVNGITAFCFDVLGARRVCIRMDERNARSRRVAERCGYEFEGVLRHDAVANDGTVRDTRMYSRIR